MILCATELTSAQGRVRLWFVTAAPSFFPRTMGKQGQSGIRSCFQLGWANRRFTTSSHESLSLTLIKGTKT